MQSSPKEGGLGHSGYVFVAHKVAAKTRTRLSTSCFTAYVQMHQALNQVTTLVLLISIRLTPARPPWPWGKASRSSLFKRMGELNRPLHWRLLSTCLAKIKVDIFVPIWLPVLCVCPWLEFWGSEGWDLEPKVSMLYLSFLSAGSNTVSHTFL